MALNHLQEPKITPCKHEVSHFYFNYFLYVAFRVIFEALSYMSYKRPKLAPTGHGAHGLLILPLLTLDCVNIVSILKLEQDDHQEKKPTTGTLLFY